MAIAQHDGPARFGPPGAMTYGVVVHTLGRTGGDGITMLLVEASNPLAAEHAAVELAEARFGCNAIAEHAVPCPDLPANASARGDAASR